MTETSAALDELPSHFEIGEPGRGRLLLRKRLQRLLHSRFVGWTLVLSGLVFWEVSVASGLVRIPAFPAISTIGGTWWVETSSGTLSRELFSTLSLMFAGYFLAATFGFLVGLFIGVERWAWALLEPVIELVRPVPISASVPLLILFLGIDAGLKITAVMLGTIFPILLATYAGVRAVSQTMRDTAKTFELTRWQAVWEVIVPHAAPQIFVGLRTSLAIALIITVFSEMIAGSAGIGFFILQAQQTLSVDKLYAGVFTLAAVGYLLNVLFLAIENRLLPWRVGGPQRRT